MSLKHRISRIEKALKDADDSQVKRVAEGISVIPLWRLLVMLDDAERTIGASSDTSRILVVEIQRRLRTETKVV